MSKLRKISFSTIALAVLVSGPSAFAETQERQYKPKKKSSTISRSGQIGGGSSFWGTFWGSDFNRVDRQERRKRFVAPRPDPAAKIYTYAPDRLYSLADKRAKQPKQAQPVFSAAAPADYNPTPQELRGTKLNDSLAQTIFDILKSGQTDIRVTKAQRTEIAKFYRNRGYAALWTSMDGLEEPAHAALAVLNDAETEGLDPADYSIPEMSHSAGDIDQIESDLNAIARFDIQMTAVAVRYARHASGGRIAANRLSAYHDLKQPRVAAKTALAKLAETDQPAQYLRSLHPIHPTYAKLKVELAKVRTHAEPVDVDVPISAGPTIVPGGYDVRIPGIRARLIKDGHLQASAETADIEIIPSSGEELPSAVPAVIQSNLDDSQTEDSAVYDDDLVAAVKEFQRTAGLKPDGLIGRRTINAFNGKITKHFDKSARIVANMERLRWLPRQLGNSHVFVNQASYHLQVIKNGRQAWATKVIIGKPEHQTSFFSDQMETVVFNPYWGVPQSIIKNEMLPKLVNDPSYLDRLGYEVYNGSGRRVNSSNVDWWNYYEKVPFAVRQPPGRKNALGQLKFMFPNKHAIYLHDTPTKKLFNRSQRAYSHGCVRVQDPRKLAQTILGWNQEKIASKISTGKNQKVVLKQKLPVHLTYFTAWSGSDENINYFNDIYGRDKRLELAFAATSAAFR